MVEGGKIDWACHSNDAATVFHEVMDMDNAIKVAYEFYEQHPDETPVSYTHLAKIALMVLKAYTGFSDRQLVEHLNGNIPVSYTHLRRFRLFMSRPAPIMGPLPMWTAVIPSRACVPAVLTK